MSGVPIERVCSCVRQASAEVSGHGGPVRAHPAMSMQSCCHGAGPPYQHAARVMLRGEGAGLHMFSAAATGKCSGAGSRAMRAGWLVGAG